VETHGKRPITSPEWTPTGVHPWWDWHPRIGFGAGLPVKIPPYPPLLKGGLRGDLWKPVIPFDKSVEFFIEELYKFWGEK